MAAANDSNPFTIYSSQVIVLYTFNVYGDVYQFNQLEKNIFNLTLKKEIHPNLTFV